MGTASHKLQRILKSANIEVRHRSTKKLFSTLHTHKDQKPKGTQPGIYRIPCDCGKVYIGETGRSFNTRIKEHKTCHRRNEWEKSAIVKHAQQHQHNIQWEDSKLITTIKHWHTRRIREAIEIKQHNTVPQDNGLFINSIWNPLLNSYADNNTPPHSQDTPANSSTPPHDQHSPARQAREALSPTSAIHT